jgi:hypothetical protein
VAEVVAEVAWVNFTAKGALISKLVPRVADVLVAKVAPTLVGVLGLPVSSNSTVKEKLCEAAGRMVAVMSLDESVAVAVAVGPKDAQGVPVPPTVIVVRPPGKDATPVFTHHS